MAIKKKIVNGINYSTLHWWVRRTFGSANKCEHPNCSKESLIYEWALLKGKKYEKKRENYWQLCRKCHFQYDIRQYQLNSFNKGRLLAQKARIGSHHTAETRSKIKKSLKKAFPKGRITWNKGKGWSDEIKKKMSLARKNYYARIKK